MDIKKLVPILIGVILIAFGIGIYSLRYYDNISFNNSANDDFVNIRSEDSSVKIGKDGIDVKDGDDHVSIGWKGISVKDGGDEVQIGWNGIKVKDDKSNTDIDGSNSWFEFTPKNLKTYNIDEQKHESIDGIDSIKINSGFVDIMVTQEDRDDIWIKYHGTIKSNIVPKLETERNGKVLNIKLMSDKNSYTVSESNVILEISVPESFNKDFSISSSSADIFVNDIAGLHFDLNSGSGDIKLNNLSGKSANIITSSGDLILAELNCNSSIDSSSGDIKLYADNSSKDLKIATSSGDVVVVFEDGANYSVMCTASSGDVFTDRDISINKYKGNRYEFKEGTGDNEMRIDTSSGDIYFK